LGITLACAPLLGTLAPTNIVMLYLLGVLVAALRWGRGPAVLCAFLSVAGFDFFFVPPRFTFAVGDMQYVVTFAVMLVVALVIGQLTAGLTREARLAAAREDRVRGLYEMARELSAALLPEQIVAIGTSVLEAEFHARAVFMLVEIDPEGATGCSSRPRPPRPASIRARPSGSGRTARRRAPAPPGGPPARCATCR
jgi:two-component system sensor histidine kinase KdpD